MRHPRTHVRCAALAVVLLLAVPTGTPAVDADEGRVGAETCAACHDQVVTDFARTSHARAHGWQVETACETCHGPGAEHVDSGTLDSIVRPQLLSTREASETCLDCHSREERQFRARHAVHTLAEVSCMDCHDPHSDAEQMLTVSGTALCESCHAGVAAQFELPRSHPIADRDDACASCHEPHSATTLRVSSGFGNATCESCHFEKAGPFVFAHDTGTTDGCASCHTVHASANRHLLKHDRQVNLCYECHAGTQTPGFHSGPAFVNEKCTACHTAIHGSNTNEAYLEE